jgi:hypothetical protein
LACSARFRDIGSAIVSGLQFIFFLTPVIWTEDSVRGTAFYWLTRINPVRDAARSRARAAAVAVRLLGRLRRGGENIMRRAPVTAMPQSKEMAALQDRLNRPHTPMRG